MRIVALLAVRNEELYMERCLEHLYSQGIETYVIDNDSTDRTRQIVEQFLGRGVLGIETHHYPGYYDWVGLLRTKERLASEIDADWFIHHDADEIREALDPYRTLRQEIEAVDTKGYNAINFDEFVFLPESSAQRYEGRDYVKGMRHYFFFQPRPLNRINAWKKSGLTIDLTETGGHQVKFPGRRLYPKSFILRHYICQSLAHAQNKYGAKRVYSQDEVEKRSWHRARMKYSGRGIRLPPRTALKFLPENGGPFDRSQPYIKHLLFNS